MRISSRLIAAASLLALIGSAAPAWAGGSGSTPTAPPPSSAAPGSGTPSSGTPGSSDPAQSSTPVATASSGSPSSSTTPSSTPAPSSATPSLAAQAAYPVTGAIAEKWETVKGTVGDPTGPMQSAAGGYWQRFQHGVITYIGAAGAHALTGAVETKWSAQADQVRFTWLGFATADGGDDVTFQKGRIIRNPGRNATYMIGGSIYRTFIGAGGVPVIGLPVTDEETGKGVG